MAPLVQTKGLGKDYPSGGTVVRAVAEVSLTIERGEFVAIRGRSGSGKSTLLHLLGLLERPDRGAYSFNGRAVARLPEAACANVRNREIGFVFQSSSLLPRADALENVELPLVYAGAGLAERRRRARAALDRVGMSHRARHWPNQLSGGEQQRVAIARAIVADPELLLADEPTGALDSETGEQILALFEDINREGRTLALVTHAAEIARRAGRRIVLHDGRIVDDDGGPAEAILMGAQQ